MTILETLYAAKAGVRERDRAREPYDVVRERALARMPERRSFASALHAARGCALIAEIKRASPSAGLIAPDFDPAATARTYAAAGADAISVLTEESAFLGDLAFLDVVRANAPLPILRKDFLSEAYDVAQAAAYGADAVLAIVAGLDDRALSAIVEEADRYALDVLVEVHDAAELARAITLGAALVGINNRDLRTFVTTLDTTRTLLPLVAPGTFVISESGLRDADDVASVVRAGAHGVLVGESLMRASDPAHGVAAIKAVVR
jgi:indole-3-glycerol phosphate synthase